MLYALSLSCLVLVVADTVFPRFLHAGCEDYGAFIHATSTLDIPSVRDVVREGSYLFAACDTAGLVIVDVSIPDSPKVVGARDTPGEAVGLAVQTGFAYIADFDCGLQILDISNPQCPVLVGSVDTPGTAFDVAVHGNYVYVADREYGLEIIDASTPSHPVILSHVSTLDYAISVEIEGNLACVAAWNAGLVILDLGDPRNPAILGSIGTPDLALDVDVLGNYAYIADYASGLQVIDVSIPQTPVIVGALDTGDWAEGIKALDGLALVADRHKGLLAISTLDPGNPALLGSVDTRSAFKLDASSEYAFIADGVYGLDVIQIENPNAVMPMGSVRGGGLGGGMVIVDSLLYVPESHAGLGIFDISDETTPLPVATLDTPGLAAGVAFYDSLMFIADADSGLLVVDNSNPRAPAVIGRTRLQGEADDVEVNWPYAYVASGIGGVQTVDVSDPKAPTVVSASPAPGAYRVTMADSLLYVGSLGAGFRIFSLRDASHPICINDDMSGIGSVFGLDVKESYAYLANGLSLKIISIADPLSLLLAASIGMINYCYDVVVKGNYAYLACDEGGLVIVNITDPYRPCIVGGSDTDGVAGGVAVDGQVYLASVIYGTDFHSMITVLPPQCAPQVGITLESFRAQAESGRIVLYWATGETNSFSHFIIEKAVAREGPYFEIGQRQATSEDKYTLADSDVTPGILYYYRLRTLDRRGATLVYGPVEARLGPGLTPFRVRLDQAIPNPWLEGAVKIPLSLSRPGDVRLRILNVAGREIRVLVDRSLAEGTHFVIWDGRNSWGELVPAGVYLYEVEAEQQRTTKSLVRLR